MAFFRFSRDKRGYEHFYLVEPTTNRRGKSRPRVLYWFRTPPNVKIGREPFDDDVRRALEAQNPNVTFDWRKILETPIPSAEVEPWRERRRAERAARQSAHGVPRDDDHAAPDEAAAEESESEAPAEAESIPTVVESAAATTAAPSRIERARKRRRRRKGGRGPQPAMGAPAPAAESAPHEGGASASTHGEPPAREDVADEPPGE